MTTGKTIARWTFWRRQWHPTPILLPGKSHGWRSLVGCSPWSCEESDTTEQLHFHFSLSCTAEGNGNPLQCSCLENPRDGRAWWAAVYGVTESRTWLEQLSSSSSIVDLECCTNSGGSENKESTCDARDLGSVPGLGRSPVGGHDNPLQYSCPENSKDWGAWHATVRRVIQRQTQLSYFAHKYIHTFLNGSTRKDYTYMIPLWGLDMLLLKGFI